MQLHNAVAVDKMHKLSVYLSRVAFPAGLSEVAVGQRRRIWLHILIDLLAGPLWLLRIQTSSFTCLLVSRNIVPGAALAHNCQRQAQYSPDCDHRLMQPIVWTSRVPDWMCHGCVQGFI